ncbi:MAG: tetratricopeptide repeat protein [Candidatus Latescibacteria bacterium]|nr:tetratricopeptide repeat protein [Candidatus Latescibacterota bacterium]
MHKTSCFLFALLLLQPPASPAQESASSLYDMGTRQYAEGDYESALSSFKSAIRVDKSLQDAHYWLGMSLYQMSDYPAARKEFIDLGGLRSAESRVLRALGAVYLKERNRAFEALDVLHRATQISPLDAEAHYLTGLAYLTLMSRGPVAEHPYVDKARNAFNRALELSPRHFDASYRLGKLYEGESIQNRYIPNKTDSFYTMSLPFEGKALNVMSAMAAFDRQLKSNPAHVEARHALATLNSRLGNHATAIRSLEGLARAEPDNVVRLLDLGIAYWRAKEWVLAEEIFERVVPKLPENEQEIYRDFGTFVNRKSAAEYDKANESDQAVQWRDFFALRDPVPVTEVNERLIEHYGRVAYARQSFTSKGVFPWDRRGDIVVRYGLPDHVEFGSGITENMETGSTPLSMRNWGESWVYVHVPMTLYFENRQFSRRYDFPPIFAGDGINYDHPYFVARQTIERTPSLHIPRELGAPLEIHVDPVAFRDANGDAVLELAYGVSREETGITEAGMVDRALDLGAVLYGPEWDRTVVDSTWSPLFVAGNDRGTISAIAVQELRADPGAYWMAAQAHDRQYGLYGVLRDSVVVPDFSRAGVKMSGIRLAIEMAREVEDRAIDMKLPDRLAPNPTRLFYRATPLHFYFELYDLSLGEDSLARFQVQVSLHPSEESMTSRNIIWRMLSRAETIFRRARQKQVVTFMFEERSESPMTSWVSAIDTSDLTLGNYRLEVFVTDLTSGATVSQGQMFRVAK